MMGSLVLLTASYLAGEAFAQQPSGPTSASTPLRMTQAELELYERAPTLVDWTPKQLRLVPMLHKLRRAENQVELVQILERVGKSTARLFSDFPNISCDEEVYSQSNARGPSWVGQGIHANDLIRHFRYIIIPKPVGDLPVFEEYRTERDGRPVEITKGAGLRVFDANFAGSWIYLSPSDQPYNRFRYFGTQSVQKRECFVVGFAQDPRTARILSAFRLVDPPVGLLVQGLAWIDKQSLQVLRIQTWLLAPRADIGLGAQNTLVNYFSVQPAGLDRSVSVPHDVTVTVFFRGTAVRNTHRYSKFQLFRVESAIKPAE